MWKESSIKVGDEVFHYWMKQYDEVPNGASRADAFPSSCSSAAAKSSATTIEVETSNPPLKTHRLR